MYINKFYDGKRVFVTGHTGFKGSWLCYLLKQLGAEVSGFSLEPPTEPALYNIARIGNEIKSYIGDVSDYKELEAAFTQSNPEIVFHLAAQPIVRESYRDPVNTYKTNVMGTVHILECVRNSNEVRSLLNVTTDKVYKNREWYWGYREDEELDGFDPYSNSKSCSELVTKSYKRALFNANTAISTARAGNVIGGGDFASDRIIPDCVRAAMNRERIIVRNPYSIRPYQHVLEPIYAYLLIAAQQYEHPELAGSYNVGPNDEDCIQTGDLVDLFVNAWGDDLVWINKYDGGPHEASFLKLDCSKMKNTFSWKPRWDIATAVTETVEWYKCMANNGDTRSIMDKQIKKYLYEEAKTSGKYGELIRTIA
ncbi:CDP-glucose 4,6-dehydratase [Clostridia bacterium]|nr:CDP-glucose 4,6-dehydratase [Clostridia bacterium]